MLGAGFLQSEAVLGKANEKLEQAIEELRVKYEKKAQVEAAEAAAKAKAAGAGGDDEGKKSKEEEMTMDDPDLEALRKARNNTSGSERAASRQIDRPPQAPRLPARATWRNALAPSITLRCLFLPPSSSCSYSFSKCKCSAAVRFHHRCRQQSALSPPPPLAARGKQSRIEALKSASMARKGHRASGHGELREIVEEDFLKDVTSTECVLVFIALRHALFPSMTLNLPTGRAFSFGRPPSGLSLRVELTLGPSHR